MSEENNLIVTSPAEGEQQPTIINEPIKEPTIINEPIKEPTINISNELLEQVGKIVDHLDKPNDKVLELPNDSGVLVKIGEGVVFAGLIGYMFMWLKNHKVFDKKEN